MKRRSEPNLQNISEIAETKSRKRKHLDDQVQKPIFHYQTPYTEMIFDISNTLLISSDNLFKISEYTTTSYAKKNRAMFNG